MKYLLILIGGLAVNMACGQNHYEWINSGPYHPDILPQQLYAPFLETTTGIKTVVEKSKDIRQDVSSTLTQTTYSYSPEGKLTHFEEIQPDGSINRQAFFYLPDGEFEYRTITYLFNAGKRAEVVKSDTLYELLTPIYADSLVKDSLGRIVLLKLNNTVAITAYDKQGRKSKEEVLKAPHNTPHVITYTYRRRKVVKKIHYSTENIEIVERYKLDKSGNWVHLKITGNLALKRSVIKRELRYY